MNRLSTLARYGQLNKAQTIERAGLGPDTILPVEDHAPCENGEDRGELMLSFSPSVNPHLL